MSILHGRPSLWNATTAEISLICPKYVNAVYFLKAEELGSEVCYTLEILAGYKDPIQI